MKRFWSFALIVPLTLPLAAQAQSRIITGRVTSAVSHEPLPYASVSVLGTIVTAVTNDSGDFSLAAPDGAVTLLVRRIGYKQKQVTVGASEATVDVALEQDVFNLEAVVVTGLATGVTQQNLANDVTTIRSGDVARAPTPTLESALQGKIPGAEIQMNSGAPGGGGQIDLRGVTTINARIDPLIVVDGVVISNEAIPNGMNAVTNAAGGGNTSNQDNPVNRIADLNPADIAQIQVLKGASAAAIYGSQAANGVILITTKRGQPGKPRFSMSQSFGEYRDSKTLGSRVFKDSADAASAFGHDSLVGALCRGGCPAFDPEAVLYGAHPLSEETDASVSGGTGQTNYYLSGLVKYDGGVAQNTGYGKQSVRANIDQLLGSGVRVSVNTQVIHSLSNRGISNNDNTGTSTYLVLPFTPSFFDLRPVNGVYPDNPFAQSNPLQTFAYLKNAEDVWHVLGTTNMTWQALQTPTQSLQATVTGGVDYFSQRNDIVSPPFLQFEPNDGLPGTIVQGKSSGQVLNLLGSLVHKYTPSSGAYTATTSAGFQYLDQTTNQTSLVGRDILAGATNIQEASDISSLVSPIDHERTLALYGQEEFLALDQRLLLTAGLRGERASVNGDVHHYYLFPKASASYRFLHLVPQVDELKLRAAWGQTGNLPQFGTRFNPDATGVIGGEFGTFVAGAAGDQDIKPERNTEIELGGDLTFANQFATLSATIYQKTITDLILTQTLAPSTGQGTRTFNGGKLRNRGIELSLQLAPVRSASTTWLVQTSLYSNSSLVQELPVPAFQVGGFGTGLGAFQIQQGRSATQIVGNDSTGAVVVVGDANPKFQASLSSDLTWHRWSLSFLWDWKDGGDVINLTQLLYDAAGNSADWNSGGSQRWGEFLKGNTQVYVQDGSYLKLREVSITYDVPTDVATRLFGSSVQSVRLSLSGRNLLTFSPYAGLDPEVSNFGNQAIARNIDVAPFPPNRSFFFTVDLGF